MERSSDTLRALAELDVAELQRHKQNTLMWQVGLELILPLQAASRACAGLLEADL